jgi:hypothetical protein
MLNRRRSTGKSRAETADSDVDDEQNEAEKEFTEIVRRKWLTERGFDDTNVNSPRARFPCDYPIHVAVFEGNFEQCKYLFMRNASLVVVNKIGDGPLQNSCASVSPSLVSWFNQNATRRNQN